MLGRKRANLTSARFAIERLEDRNLLAVDPLQLNTGDAGPDYALEAMLAELAANPTVATTVAYDGSLVAPPEAIGEGAAAALLEIAPFPLDQTFLLHSNPSATKTIYLDFDGHITTGTQWNIDNEAPVIVTPAFTVDGDFAFSDAELMVIQSIWERVAEDFRPFNVNVTTQEPPLSDLISESFDDNRFGIRVAIGGTNMDWLFDPNVGGIAYLTSFSWSSDTPTFVFNVGGASSPDPGKITVETISHEVGHTLGLGHDGDIVPPTEEEEDPPPNEYYFGHGDPLPMGLMGWGPIMGAPFDKNITQWSKGEYPRATNGEDDLAIITSGFNGFGYRADDHGNLMQTASVLGSTNSTFLDEGIIERNTDLDYFEFTIGGLGETISLDIDPFYNGPNLDILAKIYNSSGVEIAMSNPRDALDASFSLTLGAGTYYLVIDGTGRPQTTATDFGYTDYGSLGYYSIVGTRKEILVGVDFDLPGGAIPTNWTRYTGSPVPAVLTDLKNESNFVTPFNLAINTGGAPITRTTNTINTGTLPIHAQPLDNLSGYLSSSLWNFTWSDLAPSTAYEIFVFGLSNVAGINNVQVIGAEILNFTQTHASNDLIVNAETGSSSEDLANLGLTVLSSSTGTIEISVTPDSGVASIGGLGIRPGKLGAIEGQKWHDENGDGIKDSTESGLAGWTIYLDENKNGVFDSNASKTVASTDVPQAIIDNAVVKSDLIFSGLSRINDIDVTLNITHTYDTDLHVHLVSPLGTRVELFSNVGGSGDNFTNTIFDDEAATVITAGLAPFSGRFRPEGFLGAFNGEDPNGIWTLEITDQFNGNVGTLNSWSVTITGSEISTVTDEDGNYAFEELTPGVYHLGEVLQSGWAQTFAPPEVRLNSGARVQDVDFGNWVPDTIPGSIQGQKWEDTNEDGVKDPGEPGLSGWVIFLDGNGNGVFDSATTETIASADVPKAITDFSTIISQLNFEGGLSSIQDVNVTLDVTHSFAADLDAYLISPSGRQVKLFTDVGGQFNDFQGTVLDDDATTSIADAEAPFNGSFRPEGLLGDFNGEDPNGIWQLLIRDTNFGDEGVLNSWSLTVESAEPSTVTDENGNYEFLDLAPGAYRVYEVGQPGWTQTAPVIPTGNTWWDVVVDSNTAVTEIDFGNVAAVLLPGDYNLDGMVDAADYAVWRDTMGANVTPYSGADGNGDGRVDEADRLVWVNNFGAQHASGSAADVSEALLVEPEAQESPVEAAAGVSSTLPSVDSLASFDGNEVERHSARRATRLAFVSLPAADRADATLLAWFSSRQDSTAERTDFRAMASDRWSFAERSSSERPLSDRIESSFATAVDRVFANLGV